MKLNIAVACIKTSDHFAPTCGLDALASVGIGWAFVAVWVFGWVLVFSWSCVGLFGAVSGCCGVF